MTKRNRKPRLARSQKTYNPHVANLAHALFHKEEITYTTDEQGRNVRIPKRNGGVAVTKDEMVNLLWNVRAVDEDDALEQIGPEVWAYMVAKGYVVKSATGPIFWVTQKAADTYALPKPVVAGREMDFYAGA